MSELSTYTIYGVSTATTAKAIEVKAENPQSALEKAWESQGGISGTLCHYCTKEVELSGDWEFQVVNDEGEIVINGNHYINHLESQLNTANERIKEYQRSINEIDDYFEYSNESLKDRRKVHNILKSLTERIAKQKQ